MHNLLFQVATIAICMVMAADALIESTSIRPEDIVSSQPTDKVRVTFKANMNPFTWIVRQSSFSYGLEVFLPEDLTNVGFSFQNLFFVDGLSTAGEDVPMDETPVQTPTIFFNVTGTIRNCTFDLIGSEMESGIHFYVNGGGSILDSKIRIRNIATRNSGHAVRFYIAGNSSETSFSRFESNQVTITNTTDTSDGVASVGGEGAPTSVGVSYNIGTGSDTDVLDHSLGASFSNNNISHTLLHAQHVGVLFETHMNSLLSENMISTQNVHIKAFNDSIVLPESPSFVGVAFALFGKIVFQNQFFTSGIFAHSGVRGAAVWARQVTTLETDYWSEVRNNVFDTQFAPSAELSFIATIVFNNTIRNHDLDARGTSLSLMSPPSNFDDLSSNITSFIHIAAPFNSLNHISTVNINGEGTNQASYIIFPNIPIFAAFDMVPSSLSALVTNGFFGAENDISRITIINQHFVNVGNGLRFIANAAVAGISSLSIECSDIEVMGSGAIATIRFLSPMLYANNVRVAVTDSAVRENLFSNQYYGTPISMDVTVGEVSFMDVSIVNIYAGMYVTITFMSGDLTVSNSIFDVQNVTVESIFSTCYSNVYNFQLSGPFTNVTSITKNLRGCGGIQYLLEEVSGESQGDQMRQGLTMRNANIDGLRDYAIKLYTSSRSPIIDLYMYNENITSNNAVSSSSFYDFPAATILLQVFNTWINATIINEQVSHTNRTSVTGAIAVHFWLPSNGYGMFNASQIVNDGITVAACVNAIAVRFSLENLLTGFAQGTTVTNMNLMAFHADSARLDGDGGNLGKNGEGNNRALLLSLKETQDLANFTFIAKNISLVIDHSLYGSQADHNLVPLTKDVAVEISSSAYLYSVSSEFLFEDITVASPANNNKSLLSFNNVPLPSTLVKMSAYGTQTASKFMFTRLFNGEILADGFQLYESAEFTIRSSIMITDYIRTPTLSDSSNFTLQNCTVTATAGSGSGLIFDVSTSDRNSTVNLTDCNLVSDVYFSGSLGPYGNMFVTRTTSKNVTFGVYQSAANVLFSSLCLSGRLILSNSLSSFVDFFTNVEFFSSLRLENSALQSQLLGPAVEIQSTIDKSYLLFSNTTIITEATNATSTFDAVFNKAAVVFTEGSKLTNGAVVSFINNRIMTSNASYPCLIFTERTEAPFEQISGRVELWGNEFINGGVSLVNHDMWNENATALDGSNVGLIVGNKLPSLSLAASYRISCNTNQASNYSLNISTISPCATNSYSRCPAQSNGVAFVNPQSTADTTTGTAVVPCRIDRQPVMSLGSTEFSCPVHIPNQPTTTTSTTTSTTTTTTSTTTTTTPTSTTTTLKPTTVVPTTTNPNSGRQLSTVGYGSRYVEYTPTQLFGLYSGISLLYSETYKSYGAKRFLYTGSSSVPAINGIMRFTFDSPQQTQSNVTFAVALSKSSATLDWTTLQSVVLNSSFVDPANNSRIVGDMSQSACGDLLTYNNLRTMPYGSSLASTNTTSGQWLSSMLVGISANSQQLTCRSTIRFSGMSYSSASFRDAPMAGYVYAPVTTSTVAPPLTIDDFKLNAWLGSQSAPFTVLDIVTDGVIVGTVGSSSITTRSQSMLFVTPQNQPSFLTIGANTTNTVVCTVGEQKAFSATLIPSGTPLFQGTSSGCYTYDTVDDIHLACLQSSTCVGFTTIRMQGPKELPLCIYSTSGGSSADSMNYPRIFYTKPSTVVTPQCTVGVERRGQVAIYVQQTAMASGVVSVIIDGSIVTLCGGANRFQGNFAGVDGRCNQWALCYSGIVSSGSNVTVASTSRLDQNGCVNSLGVMFNQTSIEDQTTVPGQTESTTLARYYLGNAVSRPMLKQLTNTDPIRIFIYRGLSAALDVLQTGFSCALPNSQCNQGKAAPVSMVTASSCQSCGGLEGFFGGRSGESDRCGEAYLCGTLMTLNGDVTYDQCASQASRSPEKEFSDFVSVTADIPQFASQTALCSGFFANLYVTSTLFDSGSTGSPLLFPFSSDSYTFNTLLAAASTGSVDPAGDLLAMMPKVLNMTNITSDDGFLTHVTTINGLDVMYADWYQLQGLSIQSVLPINSLQMCVVDHSGEAAAQCNFYIPQGANRMTVTAAQTDFATKQMTVDVRLDGQTLQSTDTCGGKKKFGYSVGLQERCDAYSVCTNRFLYGANSSDAEHNTQGIVTVNLPSNMRSYSCNFVAVIYVQFSYETDPVLCENDEYTCPGDRNCVDSLNVCDGIQDCFESADEEGCRDKLLYLEDEGVCLQNITEYLNSSEFVNSFPYELTPELITDSIFTYLGAGYPECRRQAVLIGSSFFTVTDVLCTVYGVVIETLFRDYHRELVCSTPGARTYLSTTITSSFTLCRNTVQCNSNGQVWEQAFGVCACNCFSGYTGSACDVRLALTTVTGVTALIIGTTSDTLVNLYTVANALTLGKSDVTVTCDTAVGESLGIRVSCTVTSLFTTRDVDSHNRRLLQTSSLALANSIYTSSGGDESHQFASISYRTSMVQEGSTFICDEDVPLNDDNTTTTASNDSTSLGIVCSLTNTADRVRLISTRNVSTKSARITIISNSGAGRRFKAADDGTTELNPHMDCEFANTNGAGGCVVGSCDLSALSEYLQQSTVQLSITDVVYADETILTSSCDQTGMAYVATTAFGNVGLNTSDTVVNENKDYRPLLGSLLGVAFFAFAVCFVGAILCLRHYRTKLSKLSTESLPQGDFSPLQKSKAKMLIRLRLLHDAKEAGFRHDRCSSALFVAASILLIAAIFLVVLFATSEEKTSNFSVIYEEYSDNLCDRSPTAYMPLRLFTIPGTSVDCDNVETIGEGVGRTFASGACGGVSGEYRVDFRMANSLSVCRKAKPKTFESGLCMPLNLVDPDSPRTNVYVKLTCSTNELVTDREDTLRNLTGSKESLTDSVPLSSPSSRLIPSPYAPPQGTAYNLTYLAGAALKRSTSYTPATYVTQSDPSMFDGDNDGRRLVQQVSSECTFNPSATSSCVSGQESQLQGIMQYLQHIDNGPTTPDVPIGYLFGGYGTTEPSTWSAAGPEAQRYYGIAEGPFDMGHWFPKNGGTTAGESEGYAISLWMRADGNTQGFAYAVADAFENEEDQSFYTLNFLASVLDNGQDADKWLEEDYRIYHSLYVNGPSKSLTFAFGGTNAIETLTYDLLDIDSAYVLNGQWHQIAITFVVENEKIRAQLVIDGRSSYSSASWSSCVQELPEPISSIPRPAVNGNAPVYDRRTDRVVTGGVLVVGYFSGGVYGLQATNKALFNTDFLTTGTRVMRDANPFPRTSTLALGMFLLIFSFLLLVFVIVTFSRDAAKQLEDASTNENLRTAEQFYHFMESAARSTEFFGRYVEPVTDSDPTAPGYDAEGNQQAQSPNEVDVLNSTDDADMEEAEYYKSSTHKWNGLRPITLYTALQWTSMDVQQFRQTMDDVTAMVSRKPVEALLLLIYQHKVHSSEVQHFTAEEWNNHVEERTKQHGRDVKHWYGTTKSDVNREVELFGGKKNMFAELFGPDGAATQEMLGDRSKRAKEAHEKKSRPVDREQTASTTKARSFDVSSSAVSSNNAGLAGMAAVTNITSYTTNNQGASFGAGSVNTGQGTMSGTNGSIGGAQLRGAIQEALMPFFAAIQTVYVWATSIDMPEKYDKWFESFFSFVSVDFTMAFPDITGIVTPILQVSIGLTALAFVMYCLLEDDRCFTSALARYVWRRDAVAHSSAFAGKKIGEMTLRGNSPGSTLNTSTGSPPGFPDLEENLMDSSTRMMATATTAVMAISLKDREKKYQLELGKADITFTDPGSPKLPPQLYEALQETINVRPVNKECVATALPVRESRTIDLFTGALSDPNPDDKIDYSGWEQVEIATDANLVLSVQRRRDLTEEELKAEHHDKFPIMATPSLHATTQEEFEESKRSYNNNRTKGRKFQNVPGVTSSSITTNADESTNKNPYNDADKGVYKSETAPTFAPFTQWWKVPKAGVRCHVHPERYLTPLTQTDVWPYFNRPSCCLSINGNRCGREYGDVFSCGKVHTFPDGTSEMCMFALCEEHNRGSIMDLVKTMIWSTIRMLRSNGAMWILCVLSVLAVNAAYMPFMKTALMIVGCHPFYQCEFEYCWSYVDQKFAIAAYFSIVVIVFLGAGFPLAFFLILRKRRRMIYDWTIGEEYKGFYSTDKGALQLREWARFVLTEPSALASQYKKLDANWIYFPPLMILLKFFTLLPAVFIEPRTFSQRLWCAIVELVITLFVFGTKVYLSPILMLTLRVAEIHQLAILGLQNIDLVLLNDQNESLGAYMIAVTIAYIAFSFVVFFITTIWPHFSKKWRTYWHTIRLHRHGLESSAAISLYLDPSVRQPLPEDPLKSQPVCPPTTFGGPIPMLLPPVTAVARQKFNKVVNLLIASKRGGRSINYSALAVDTGPGNKLDSQPSPSKEVAMVDQPPVDICESSTIVADGSTHVAKPFDQGANGGHGLEKVQTVDAFQQAIANANDDEDDDGADYEYEVTPHEGAREAAGGSEEVEMAELRPVGGAAIPPADHHVEANQVHLDEDDEVQTFSPLHGGIKKRSAAPDEPTVEDI